MAKPPPVPRVGRISALILLHIIDNAMTFPGNYRK